MSGFSYDVLPEAVSLPEARWLAKVEIRSGHWVRPGSLFSAQAYSWRKYRGRLTTSDLDHLRLVSACGYPGCCRPDHLELVKRHAKRELPAVMPQPPKLPKSLASQAEPPSYDELCLRDSRAAQIGRNLPPLSAAEVREMVRRLHTGERMFDVAMAFRVPPLELKRLWQRHLRGELDYANPFPERTDAAASEG